MTRRKAHCMCKGISDKDFIFDVFSDKGFVTDAGSFFNTNENYLADEQSKSDQHECDHSDNLL
nr:hypothetical protein [uncultured Carboxylicivirga sp.]